ncbi:MAG: hypothetical protein ABGW87_10465 [Sphingomonadaceae bacterium]
MAFWGGAKLRAEVEKQKIVSCFDPGKIDCSAYTLTLGAEAFVTPSFGDDLRENLKKKLTEPIAETVCGQERRKGGGSVVIPPGQFAFLLTEEIVSIPNNVMGFISLKSKAKFRGLINVSGFHVDPGFKGRLIYSVFNAGPAALSLSRGDSLFLLWLADLSGPTEKGYYKDGTGYVEIPSDLVTEVSRETHSLQDLANRVVALSESVRMIRSVAAGLGVALGLIIAALSLAAAVWALVPGASAKAPLAQPAKQSVGEPTSSDRAQPIASTVTPNQVKGTASGGSQSASSAE